MGGQRSDYSAKDIADMLNAEAAGLCRVLLSNGKEAGGFWCVGDVANAPGNSLKVRLRGDRMGGWADYSRSPSERGGKGDMLTLVELARPWSPQIEVPGNDTASAVRWAKQWLGIDGGLDPGAVERQREKARRQREKAEADRTRDGERKRRWAEAMWQGAVPIHRAPPALEYFKGRGIDFAAIGRVPGAMRFRADIKHRERPGDQRFPAIVSAMIGPDGRHMATHATYLERLPDGRWVKLRGVLSPKLAFGSPVGAHIPVSKGMCRKPLKDIAPGTPVECSEGIEDALSVAMAFPEARVIAAWNLWNIGQVALPPQAGDYIIIGQHDAEGSPAEATLVDVIAAQKLRGVQDGSNRRVLVRWPEPGFKDFNDQLRGVRM